MAVVHNGLVTHLDIEAMARQQTKAYIYKGKITRIEPSLEACFVDYGAERHGFLPLKEIAPQYFSKVTNEQEKPSIRDLVREGQELIVQVEKIERGNKGAALTTYITLAGSYLVLMPTDGSAGGVSRRIDGQERSELLGILNQLVIPEGMGVILRTASAGKSIEELQWDLDILVNLWMAIDHTARQHRQPILIHQESNAIIRALRDYLREDIDEVVINNPDVFEEAKKYVELIRPDFAEKIKLHTDLAPLFTHYQIEQQINSVFKRQLHLPSGGSLVIDVTEALVAIDINSARATKGGDIEETAVQTNLEAADEIARQLRLRDIGGLIVIDFIDMSQTQHQRDVEERLKAAIEQDKAKIQLGKISRFGLLEMSRQRLRSTLAESTKLTCPHCQGHGLIRSIPSLSLAILRAIEDAAREDNITQVRAHLPIEIATYLLNDHRDAITAVEKKQHATVLLIPNVHLSVPEYEIEKIRTIQGQEQHQVPSYKLAMEFKQTTEGDMSEYGLEDKPAPHKPALRSIDLPIKPRKAQEKAPGILKKIMQVLFGETEKPTKNARKTNGNGTRKHHGTTSRGRSQQHQHSGPRKRTSNRRPHQQQTLANNGKS